jgi:hypothetical protein
MIGGAIIAMGFRVVLLYLSGFGEKGHRSAGVRRRSARSALTSDGHRVPPGGRYRSRDVIENEARRT